MKVVSTLEGATSITETAVSKVTEVALGVAGVAEVVAVSEVAGVVAVMVDSRGATLLSRMVAPVSWMIFSCCPRGITLGSSSCQCVGWRTVTIFSRDVCSKT